MPIYEYQCLNTQQVVEVIFPLSKANRRIIPCPLHTKYNDKGEEINWHDAEKLWSQPANIQLAPPTRIFINPRTGEAVVAANKYEKPPFGCVEKELKGPIERSKFEKEDNQRVHVQDEIDTYRMDQRRQAHQKVRHDEITAKMNAMHTEVHPDTGEEIKHHLEPQTKSMLKIAMERSKNKRVPKKETVRKLAVNHQNSSNLIDVV